MATVAAPAGTRSLRRESIGKVRRSILWRASSTAKGRAGLLLTLSVVGVAVIGPAFAPYDPDAFQGAPFAPPTPQYRLGLDEAGRDVLSRVLHGGLDLLLVAGAAAAIAIVAGGLLGIAAAYFEGAPDTLIMRICDVFLSFPQIVFVLLIVSVLGTSVWLIVLAVAVSQMPALARVMRSAALEVRERDSVKAVQLWRPGPWRIIVGEIAPNVTGPFMVEAGLRFTYSVIVIAGISFLGFGLQAPNPNWGLMISENRLGITANPYAVLVPALLIAVLTVGINMFTDAIAGVALRGSGQLALEEAAFTGHSDKAVSA